MKILKKLMAATLAFAMAASVAVTGFAMTDAATAQYKVTSKVSAVYTENEKNYVDVSFYVGKVDGEDVVSYESYEGCTVYFKTKYNITNVAHTNGDWSTDYTASKSNMKEANKTSSGTLNYTISNDGSAVTFDPSKALVTIKFELKQATAGTYPIFSEVTEVSMADDGNNLVSSKNGNMDASAVTAVTYTIAAAGGDDDTISATKAEAANGANTNTYTFENSDAMAGKKVVMQNAKMPTTGMTADTRFIVSDGTRTQIFGSDIWAKLGAEGDGVIDVANVIFGIIVDAANTSTFTFTVE